MNRDELIKLYGVETNITINHDIKEIRIYTNTPKLLCQLKKSSIKCIRQDVVKGKVFGGLYLYQEVPL